nr:elastin-like [Setaria viridis]
MDAAPAAGNLDLAVKRGRSGGGLQDAASRGASGAPYVSGGGAGGAPFVWPGGPPTGPLGALLAAVGVPPGMVAGAWPGGAATAAGQPPAQQPGIPAAAGLAAGAWPGIPSAAMPASTGMPGGWPEWWAGAAAAALGPDWLRADPQLASQETASQEVGGNDERLPVRVTSGPVRSSSTRRRGTRAPRPPPAARTATAPASVDVDLTDPSGIAPSSANLSRESSPIPIDDEDEADKVDSDSEPEEVTPRSVQGSKRGRGASNMKGKKPKTSTGHWFQEQMGKIVEMNERTTASCESIARREDTSGCSIQDVMALVKNCGALPSTNEHFVASLVFTKRAEREMFMTLDTPEERFDWLKRKYEWMTRNDVPK